MRSRLTAVLVGSLLASCGARTGFETPDATATAEDVSLEPLGISADFYVSTSTDSARPGATANGVFWTGERRPMPGGSGGASHRLNAGESISINGVALMGAQADWGYTYQGAAIPPPADGRWVFRFVVQGRTITRSLVLQPVRWVGFPTSAVSIARGVTLRWDPPLPGSTRRQAYLTSCVLNERTEVGTASATFNGRLSANPCASHAQLYATLEAPLGPPFRSGTLSASTVLDRELRVVP